MLPIALKTPYAFCAGGAALPAELPRPLLAAQQTHKSQHDQPQPCVRRLVAQPVPRISMGKRNLMQSQHIHWLCNTCTRSGVSLSECRHAAAYGHAACCTHSQQSDTRPLTIGSTQTQSTAGVQHRHGGTDDRGPPGRLQVGQLAEEQLQAAKHQRPAPAASFTGGAVMA